MQRSCNEEQIVGREPGRAGKRADAVGGKARVIDRYDVTGTAAGNKDEIADAHVRRSAIHDDIRPAMAGHSAESRSNRKWQNISATA